jgi:predicted aldo/keto reductase-like oxidoreductase
MVLGKTGLEVCRLGFGGIPIQRVDEAQAVETVRHAVEKGVDFIDTSRMYTTSERRIGKALRKTGGKVTLATKSFQRTSEGIRQDVETSLRELQTAYIDLYQCHAVSNEREYERVISAGGALEGLLKERENGRIGHIGITSHNLDLLERAVEEGLFETIMVCVSFLEPAATERVIPMALEKDMGVIAMKSFSGGVIDDPRLALKYAFSQPGVLLIPGVEHPDLVDENWEIFCGSHELTAEECLEIEKMRKRYDKTFCRRCDYCLPCPEGISIQMVLGLPSILKRMGRSVFESGHFRQLLTQAEKCSACGECMTRCPYGLPIPDLIRENIEWFRSQS